MASGEKKSKKFQNFHEKNLNIAILAELNEQRKTSKFCDVILKVFEGHIPAHSNVLAAGSPYISAFFAPTLPRQYSQALPQMIELQIDDNDSPEQYQIAVRKIVDFIYTAEIELTESDHAKVLMIAKILQVGKVVELCENFANGNAAPKMELFTETGAGGDGIDVKGTEENSSPPVSSLISESGDTHDKLSSDNEMPESCLSPQDSDNSVKDENEGTAEGLTDLISDSERPSRDKGMKSKLQYSKVQFSPRRSNVKGRTSKTSGGKSTVSSPKVQRGHSVSGVRRSCRNIKPNAWHVQDYGEEDEKVNVLDFLKNETKTEGQEKTGEDVVNCDDDNMAADTMDTGSGNEDSDKHLKCSQCDYRTSNTYRYKRHLSIHAGGKYSCEHCSFSTVKLRELSIHQRKHQHEQNMCSFCDYRAETYEDLQVHLARHDGPFPHFCEFCDKRFKTQTQLKFHIPKHSDEKPFVCAICTMGFKWKHALKSHMIVHSSEKNHLCDVCGYATAHKSQLKAHRLIHTGETFKCNVPGCKFQAIKKQNLKYHQLTHTREKPHQCEICGQSFSLVKNLRRHMMLHSTFKPHQCEQCTFSTTRYDKLKEHMRRQHSVGKTVNKRTSGQVQLLADIVSSPSANVTTDITDPAAIQTLQTDQLVSVQQSVLTMNSLGQAQQIIISPEQHDENSSQLTTFSLQKTQVLQSPADNLRGTTLEQLSVTQAENQNVLQTVELAGDGQQQILPSSNIVALRPVQFLEIQFPTMQNVEVVDLKSDV